MSCLQPFLQASVSEVIKSPAGLAVSKKKKKKRRGWLIHYLWSETSDVRGCVSGKRKHQGIKRKVNERDIFLREISRAFLK